MISPVRQWTFTSFRASQMVQKLSLPTPPSSHRVGSCTCTHSNLRTKLNGDVADCHMHLQAQRVAHRGSSHKTMIFPAQRPEHSEPPPRFLLNAPGPMPQDLRAMLWSGLGAKLVDGSSPPAGTSWPSDNSYPYYSAAYLALVKDGLRGEVPYQHLFEDMSAHKDAWMEFLDHPDNVGAVVGGETAAVVCSWYYSRTVTQSTNPDTHTHTHADMRAHAHMRTRTSSSWLYLTQA